MGWSEGEREEGCKESLGERGEEGETGTERWTGGFEIVQKEIKGRQKRDEMLGKVEYI